MADVLTAQACQSILQMHQVFSRSGFYLHNVLALQVVALINDKYKVGDELKRSIRDDILRLIEAKTYRGRRHVLGLPLRGQKTKCNASTARKFKRHIAYDVK